MSYSNLLKSAANMYYNIENNSCRICHECSKVKNHHAPNCQTHEADNNNTNANKHLTLLKNPNVSDTTESLYYAIKQENARYVAMYLDQGASLDVALNQLGHTPLHLAAIFGSKPIVAELLSRGADWRAKDASGACVLHTVVAFNRDDSSSRQKVIEVLTIFLDFGLEVDSMDARDRTPLAVALERRMHAIAEFLIDRGADVNHCDWHGRSLAHRLTTLASDNREHTKHYARLMVLLISRGASVDRKSADGLTPVDLSVKYSLDHITFVLLQHINCVPVMILHVLVDIASTKRVEELARDCGMQEGIDVYGLVERLIRKGASADAVNAGGYSPLHLAVERAEDEKLIATLLKYSRNIDGTNDKGYTMVRTLIQNYIRVPGNRTRCLNALREFVGKGANVNEYNGENFTAVHVSIRENLAEVFEVLREKANFHVLTKNGDNAFHLASRTKETNREIIDVLLMQGYDLTRANREGLTALHLASQSGNLQAMNALLDQGVDVNCRERRLGRTPLLVAAETNNSKAIAVLLRKGADANARDASGKTALLKIDCRRFGLVGLLLRFGADLDAKDREGRDLLFNALDRDEEFGTKRLYDFGASVNQLNLGAEPRDRMRVWFKHRMQKGSQFYDQIVKLETAGLPVAEIYERYTGEEGLENFCKDIVDNKKRHTFVKMSTSMTQKCRNARLKEIKAMKAQSLGESRLSVYDFLRMPPSRRMRHVETLSKMVKMGSSIENAYPEYCGVIRASYNEAAKRRSMREPAYQAFCQLFECNMPDLCVECIFDNLSNDDLNCMIVALNRNSVDYY